MMKALTEFLAARPKTEQPKMTSQEAESSAQKFANTMDELLISATTGSHNAAADDKNMENLGEPERTQPLIDGSMNSQTSIAAVYAGTSAEQAPDATTSLTGTASSSDDVSVPTSQVNSGIAKKATSASISTEITLNMVEAGRKFAGHLSETPINTMTVPSTAASISSANKAAVATPDAVYSDNSIIRTGGVVHNAELLGVAERLPSSQSSERPSVDPRLEAATDRAAMASSAAVAKVDLTARQTAPFDTGIKLSNTEPQQFAGEMATHIRVLKSQSGGEVKLNLHPAELGRMSISVSTEGNETRVAFVVETSQARQAVETALPRLRDMLENAGLTLSDSDVSEQHDSQAGADERGRGGSRGETATTDSEGISTTTVLSVKVDPDRLIDTYI